MPNGGSDSDEHEEPAKPCSPRSRRDRGRGLLHHGLQRGHHGRGIRSQVLQPGSTIAMRKSLHDVHQRGEACTNFRIEVRHEEHRGRGFTPSIGLQAPIMTCPLAPRGECWKHLLQQSVTDSGLETTNTAGSKVI